MSVGGGGVGVSVGGGSVGVSVGGGLVGVLVAGTAVLVAVSVGVGATGVWLGVLVGGTAVAVLVDVTDGVTVGGMGVSVGGTAVLVGGTGVLVGGQGVADGRSVGDGVGVAVMRNGGKKITCPARSSLLLRQLALIMAYTVVAYRSASENMVSPDCTTYCAQKAGGPQGWRVGGAGGR